MTNVCVFALLVRLADSRSTPMTSSRPNIASLLWAVALIAGCAGESGAWRGTVTDSAGIAIVASAAEEIWTEANPLVGMKLPVEKNPLRPIETYDRYLKLMAVAEGVDWRLPCALALAESTGQRISSILALRLGDLDLDKLPHGWLLFRGEHQKSGYEHWVPLQREVRQRVLEQLERLPEDPATCLFPSERDPSRPVDTSVMSRRLRRAYKRAELEPFERGLWHAWRRKWATERKGFPLKDVAAAGGWRDATTLLRCYQAPNEATLQRVVLEAPKLVREGLEAPESSPISYPTPSGQAFAGEL